MDSSERVAAGIVLENAMFSAMLRIVLQELVPSTYRFNTFVLSDSGLGNQVGTTGAEYGHVTRPRTRKVKHRLQAVRLFSGRRAIRRVGKKVDQQR